MAYDAEEESAMNKAMGMLLRRHCGWQSLCCGGAAAQTIVVGGKAFTEQQIMTAMTVALLKAKGFTPDRKAGMGSAAVRAALENGQIDVYWEYTGTGARRVQQDHRQVRVGRRRVQEDQGSRRREGHRLAQHVAGQQHLRLRDEHATRRRSAASSR